MAHAVHETFPTAARVRARQTGGTGLLRLATRAELAALDERLPPAALRAVVAPTLPVPALVAAEARRRSRLGPPPVPRPEPVGHVPNPLHRGAADLLLRRGHADDLAALVDLALAPRAERWLLASLLQRDDPAVDDLLLTARARLPRNLRRRLAAGTALDGVTRRPLPPSLTTAARDPGAGEQQLSSLLYTADPDAAAHALEHLGRGAAHPGAVTACRTLLDAGRRATLAALVERERLTPEVRALVDAALASRQGAERLRAEAGLVRGVAPLRTVHELDDGPAKQAWRRPDGARPPAVVTRRLPGTHRIDWTALLTDEPGRRRREGPLPRAVAALIAHRPDAPEALLRLAVADHPAVAPAIAFPSPDVLLLACEHRAGLGVGVAVRVAGNGLLAGTFTAPDVVALAPPDVLDALAGTLWLPGVRGTAAVRRLTGRAGDVTLRPFLLDDTGLERGRARRPARPELWEPEVYGPVVGDAVRAAARRGRDVTADQVLGLAGPDDVLGVGLVDPRVALRLAELVDEHLGGNRAAWLVALALLREGFAGTLPELLAAAGSVPA